MAYEDLCMYCFEDRNGESICPHCGRDSRAAVPQIQMLPGSLVYHERFLVGRALGQDATGIVYAAFDTKRENKLRLREYLPRDCAERLPDGSVVPIAGMEDQFEKGLKKLRASVEGVEDPRKRHFFFEENGTAYIAQRKNAASGGSGDHDDEDDDERRGNLRRVGIIAAVCAVLVIAAAVVIISLVNGALNSASDVTQEPTPGPGESWAPEVTATPTPAPSSTFAALVDPEQSWMDYTQPTASASATSGTGGASATVRPTATIRPSSSGYTTINGNSSSAEITALQQRLVTLGWLSYNNITGAYDDATRQAVRDFQTYVNETIRPSELLSVDGIAGPITLQWLYGTDSTRPTPTPTAAVTADPDDGTIDRNSTRTEIRAVQRMLITLGLMDDGSDDGVYGNTTTAAVRNFQRRVNQLQGFDVLEITGTVDPLTMAFLEYYVDWWEQIQSATPTPAPATATPVPATATPVPATGTPAPTATFAPTNEPEDEHEDVDQNSDAESIRFVQQMLIAVGLLDPGEDDGIYGSATVSAVARFQEWYNEQTGTNTLSVTGTADYLTLQYLESAYSAGLIIGATPTPAATATATPQPTATATSQPTATAQPTAQPTDIPDVPEDNVSVGPDSPEESIRYVQQMLSAVGLLTDAQVTGNYGAETENAISAFQQFVNQQLGDGTVSVTGLADQLTLQYLEQYSDMGVQITPSASPTVEPTATPAAGELTLNVNGSASNGQVVEVTGDSVAFDWSAPFDVEAYYVLVTDSQGGTFFGPQRMNATNGVFTRSQLTPGEVYTIQVAAVPVGGSQQDAVIASAQFTLPAGAATATPEPTSAPEVQLTIGGSVPSGVVEVSGENVQFAWTADGAASYNVRIVSESGQELMNLSGYTSTHGTLPTSQMTPGEVYAIGIEAVDGSGNVIASASAQFMLPAGAATPEPTEAPTAAPSAGAPQISIDGTAYNQDGVPYLTGDSAIFSWMSSGDVQAYRIYLLNEAGDRMDLGETTGTSQTLPIGQLPAGLYQIYVGAVPTGAASDDQVVWNSLTFGIPAAAATATPTAAPSPTAGSDWPTQLDRNSDAAAIQTVQMKLYQLGLLSTDGVEVGVLDTATLQAIAGFQTYMNETYDMNLPVIDPSNPDSVIDAQTLSQLQQQNDPIR